MNEIIFERFDKTFQKNLMAWIILALHILGRTDHHQNRYADKIRNDN